MPISTTINSHERRLSRCDCPGDEPEYEISLVELRHASFTSFSCRIVLAEEGPFEWYYPIKTPQQKIRTIRPRATHLPLGGDRLNDEEGHLTAIDMLSASSSTLGPTKTIFGSVTAE
jgi:hypothetical protein